MNLLDLFVKISVDDQASDAMDKLSAGMIAKATLMADGIKSAMSKAWNAITGVIGGAYNAYSEYEQQKGGIETFFGDASSTVIENAQKAYETAGMSANQYMQNVSTFAMSLIESVKERRVGAIREATEEEKKVQAEALDQQVADMQTAIADQTTAQSREHQKQRTAYSDMLSDQLSEYTKQLSKEVDQRRSALADELDALRDELAEEVEARRDEQQRRISEIQKANAQEISEKQKTNQAVLSDLQKANAQELSSRSKSLQKELQEYQKSLQAEVDAFRSATDARIKEIDREYTEKLKLTDEEEYRRLKAIDEQIEALDAQTEAERKAIKEREQQQRIASLKDEISNATYIEDREKAQQELSDYLADIEQDNRENARDEQKKGLREQRQQVQDEYAERRQKIKDEEAKVVDDYREARGKELEALQESNAEKLEERRESNQSVIDQLREEQQARVDATRESQAAEIEALRESQTEYLNSVRDTYAQEISELQKSNAEAVKERQTKNADEISELQEHVGKLTTERQRANRDALTNFEQTQQDQQTAMRRTLNEQLADLRAYVKQQKAILSGEDSGEYIETTYEDQAEAAKLADMALIDMSDNANKMGTDLGSLQAAYQGFSKQNFTMLDNLKLGFGGTKSEMERLLERAEDIKSKNGEMADYSVDSFADIVDAIHAVQTEYYVSGMSAEEAAEAVRNGTLTEQEAFNLMGTTAREGSTTVQGSFMQMKAAWDNFLIALGDPDGDVDTAMNNVMTSVGVWLDNAVPLMSRILDKLIVLVQERGPEIAQTLWDAIEGAIPEEYKEKFGGIIDAVKNLGDAIIKLSDNMPLIATIVAALTGVSVATPVISGVKGVVELLSGALGLGGAGAGLAGAASTAGTAMETAAGQVAAIEGAATTATTAIGDAAGGMATLEGAAATAAGATGFGALEAAIGTAGAVALSTFGATAIVMGPVAGIGMWLDSNEELKESVKKTADENKGNANASFNSMLKTSETTRQGITQNTADMTKTWSDKWKEAKTTTDTDAGEIESRVSECAKSINKSFTETSLHSAGAGIMDGLYNGLLETWNNTILPWLQGVGEVIKENKGPEEYDKQLLIPAGGWIMGGLYKGMKSEFDGEVKPYVNGLGDRMQGLLGSDGLEYDIMVDSAYDASNKLLNVFKEVGDDISKTFRETFVGVTESAYEAVHSMNQLFSNVQVPQVSTAYSYQRPVQQTIQQQAPQQTTVILELDHTQFARAVYQANQEQVQRVGVRLAGGYL